MSEYQVLARKYRPRKLSELVGQDTLVRTLTSAIAQNRIPHAFVLTGIRGVGKTSTARIIARSLLCTGGANEGATAEPCGTCPNCMGIQNDNHVDVIEVDAASRTGVNDIREIIDQVNYSPVMGRLKIYIIDEVHMLSKSAFNALLKTLEEPPSHVKFIFATTEVRKIPVTILSRCMRFDLPRVSLEKLTMHFKNVAAQEGVQIDEDAVKVIAGAAEGSVRDGLSLLDQAIAVSGGEAVSVEQVRNMLGLADRDNVYSLLQNMLEGKFNESLALLADLYAKGTDPVLVIKDLMEITHLLTLASAGAEVLKQASVSEAEVIKAKAILQNSGLAKLTRMWQILNKGLDESRYCPSPLMAAEMVVMRACFASGLPTPDEITGGKAIAPKPETKPEPQDTQATMFAEKKTLNPAQTAVQTAQSAPVTPTIPAAPQVQTAQAVTPQPAQTVAQSPAPQVQAQTPQAQVPQTRTERSPSYNTGMATTANGAPALKAIVNDNPLAHQEKLGLSVPRDYKELVALFLDRKERMTAAWLEEVKLISYDADAGVIKIMAKATPSYIDVKNVTKQLAEWTGKRFMFSLENSDVPTARSLNDDKQVELEKRKQEAINSTAVQTFLKEFEGSEITEVKELFE